jgi:methylated-DNA-[protein]-cysteine S-methyltransferase
VTTTVYPQSPIGPLTLFEEPAGLCGLRFGAEPGLPVAAGAVAEQLDAYFAGERHAFDLPVLLRGRDSELAIWNALREIGYGETTTYGDITRRVGRPLTDVRAVAATIGRTPVPIVVPCHRVIGADGSLTGYGGGLHRKRTLLDLESPVLTLL